MSGTEQLKIAAELLRGVDLEAPDRATVLRAATAVLDVMAARLDTLPWALMADAARLQFQLVSNGPPDVTVWRMCRVELEELCRALLVFIGLATAGTLPKAA